MKYSFAFLFFCFPFFIYCQNPYWQQEANYTIEVSLDDEQNELNGFITIEYINHSPETLSFIYLHLWPNAYKDHNTPFAKQLLQNGNTSFWFSKEAQHGYIDKIDFKLDAEVCRWQYDSLSEEICKVFLNTPLPSGGMVKISTPFHVKLPYTFSRMGHIGQSYQISQWYPKPAVFDKNGWHPMPYLDQGEFYSEFGKYDVSITLPKNYIVGATGDLQDSDEIDWMTERALITKAMGGLKNKGDMQTPASSKEMKTLHFKQSRVHDFAWFADKRYNILKGEVELPDSKRKVTTWALFTNRQAGDWWYAPGFMHDAIFYYSHWVGDYAYNQVTAVEGAMPAGGGMEYPNVTVIAPGTSSKEQLDDVITHEIGHNWFYGMLASNERDHAWMDEGINSYYENRYMQRKYPNRRMTDDLISKGLSKFFDLYRYNAKYTNDLSYQLVARENEDQQIEETSSKFTVYNYAAEVYGKSALIFDYLEAYLGARTFDSVMHKYFTEWSFKHPQPEDVRHVFEKETGKDLSWFFDDLVNSTKKIDYKIVSATKSNTENSVTIKNVNEVAAPVTILLLKKDSVISTQWVEGFSGTKTISLPASDADKVQIDAQLIMPEVNRRNNTYKFNRLAHRFEKLRLQFIGSIENQNRSQVFFAPYVAWNNYDKTQVGIALYSPSVPARKFEYIFVPAFGTGSKQFIGFAQVGYNFFPAKKVQQITIGLNAKRFSYLLFPENLMFEKLQPSINVSLKKKDPRSDFTHSFYGRSVIMWLDWLNPFNDYARQTMHYYVNEARYRFARNSTLHPFTILGTVQQGKNFMNLSAEGNFKVSYKGKNQGLFVRLFAGAFLFDNKPGSDISAPNPEFYLSNNSRNNFYWLQKDYMFDENFVDRNGRNNVLGRQVSNTGGGFYSLTSVGASRKFMGAVDISTSIYRFVPFEPFLNLAASVNDFNKVDILAEFGVSFVIIKNMLELHLPLITTKNIHDEQTANGINKWYQRITFTLKLQLPNLTKEVKKATQQ